MGVALWVRQWRRGDQKIFFCPSIRFFGCEVRDRAAAAAGGSRWAAGGAAGCRLAETAVAHPVAGGRQVGGLRLEWGEVES